MPDPSSAVNNLRERLAGAGEDRLGRALSDLLDSPLLTGTIGRAFDARGKAAQAQELAMGALNIPSAADIERLTRRLRAVSQRLEGIEDGVHRLDRALAARGVETRLSRIEEQLGTLTRRLGQQPEPASTRARAGRPAAGAKSAAKAKSADSAKSAAKAKSAASAKPAVKAKPAVSAKSAAKARSATGARPTTGAKPAVKAKPAVSAKSAAKAKSAASAKPAAKARSKAETKARPARG